MTIAQANSYARMLHYTGISVYCIWRQGQWNEIGNLSISLYWSLRTWLLVAQFLTSTTLWFANHSLLAYFQFWNERCMQTQKSCRTFNLLLLFIHLAERVSDIERTWAMRSSERVRIESWQKKIGGHFANWQKTMQMILFCCEFRQFYHDSHKQSNDRTCIIIMLFNIRMGQWWNACGASHAIRWIEMKSKSCEVIKITSETQSTQRKSLSIYV